MHGPSRHAHTHTTAQNAHRMHDVSAMYGIQSVAERSPCILCVAETCLESTTSPEVGRGALQKLAVDKWTREQQHERPRSATTTVPHPIMAATARNPGQLMREQTMAALLGGSSEEYACVWLQLCPATLHSLTRGVLQSPSHTG